ncbi:FtsK/SpoIIIE domain-containing protein [Streptomyces bottropensis]|uniref:FtsK/SpoIIIE domain-containing protein n=1 Tax=Streptomyces bottropensis TaxID=42235 RepID=UPI003679C7A0
MPPHPSHDSILARAALGAASKIGKFCRWCHRRRYELAPGAVSAGLTGLSWLHHFNGVGLGEHFVYGGLSVGAFALSGFALKHKARAFAANAAVTGAVVADAWAGAGLGPSVPSLIATGLITGGAYRAYLPWLVESRHRRLDLQIKAAKVGVTAEGLGTDTEAASLTGATNQETRLLRALVAMLGVPGIDVTGLEDTLFGWRALVELPAGRNTAPHKVITAKKQLAANMRAEKGKLRLAQGERENELVVMMYETDPLAKSIPWPGPTTATITEPVVVGMNALGEPVTLPLLYKHVLIGGATDNGKSNLQNVLVAHAVACTDAEVLLIDLKPGAVELGPWRKCARALASTPEEALQLLRFIQAEVKRRGEFLASLDDLEAEDGEPVKKWDPTEHGPAWVVFIDELARLVRDVPKASKILEDLLQVARFVGITLVCATQSPSSQVFGGTTDGRQQYQVRVGLGAPETTTANLIFGPGAYGKGWDLTELKLPGKFLSWDQELKEHEIPVEARAFWMTGADVAATRHRYALDLGESPAREHPDPEDDPPPPTPPSGGPGGGRPLLRAVPTFPDGTEIRDERVEELWLAIDKAGQTGVTKNKLVAMLDDFRSRSSLDVYMLVWEEKGWIEKAGKEGRSEKYRTVRRQLVAAEPAAVEDSASVTVSG